ncbi:MAG: thermonuclease family protein [Pirellulaceae bacterium]
MLLLLVVGCDQISLPTPTASVPPTSPTAAEEIATEEIAGQIERAMDGDSFHFAADSGERFEVRLEGIDCPEKAQPFGEAAKRWLEDLTQGRRVWLIPTGQDKYGRVLANAHDGQVWINGELIRQGLAWHYGQFNRDGRLANLQLDAQTSRVGLWQDQSPMPPWEYRKANPR